MQTLAEFIELQILDNQSIIRAIREMIEQKYQEKRDLENGYGNEASAQEFIASINQNIQNYTEQIDFYLSLIATLRNLLLQKTLSPPSKNLSSQKVLKSIESLQGFLRQKPLYTTAQARLAEEC